MAVRIIKSFLFLLEIFSLFFTGTPTKLLIGDFFPPSCGLKCLFYLPPE